MNAGKPNDNVTQIILTPYAGSSQEQNVSAAYPHVADPAGLGKLLQGLVGDKTRWDTAQCGQGCRQERTQPVPPNFGYIPPLGGCMQARFIAMAVLARPVVAQ